jgi:two-component system LytT family sensor kinase
MKKNQSIYWVCQITGWFSYGLTIIFFSNVLDRKLSSIYYPRLLVSILMGMLMTHLLRKTIIFFSLRPPLASYNWWKLITSIFVFASLYSFLTSYLIEVLHLYDNGRKLNLEKRFFVSMVFDTPIILVWVSIYILWHYIEFTNTEEIKKVKLENMIKELQLKTIKSQINPHFIFNALNSIRALVDENPARSRQAIF